MLAMLFKLQELRRPEPHLNPFRKISWPVHVLARSQR
jgi:hypothetical protein